MNRLGFADFHANHFGPEQKAHWQSMLRQQQQQFHVTQHHHYYDYSQQPQPDQEESYHHNDNYEEYAKDEQVEEEAEEEEEEDDEQAEVEISKEAIEIFRFSEAYRKEREEERLKEEQDDQKGMEDWQYDESTVHVSGGIEAPATSLVLTKKRNQKEKSSKITIQEQLLNSAYLSSCSSSSNDAPVILWPVLPFKM